MSPKIPIIKATTKKVSSKKVNRVKLIYFLTTTLMKILLKPFTLTPSDPSYFFFLFHSASFVQRTLAFPFFFFFRTSAITGRFGRCYFSFLRTRRHGGLLLLGKRTTPYTHATAIKEQKFVNLFVSRRIVKNRLCDVARGRVYVFWRLFFCSSNSVANGGQLFGNKWKPSHFFLFFIFPLLF